MKTLKILVLITIVGMLNITMYGGIYWSGTTWNDSGNTLIQREGPLIYVKYMPGTEHTTWKDLDLSLTPSGATSSVLDITMQAGGIYSKGSWSVTEKYGSSWRETGSHNISTIDNVALGTVPISDISGDLKNASAKELRRPSDGKICGYAITFSNVQINKHIGQVTVAHYFGDKFFVYIRTDGKALTYGILPPNLRSYLYDENKMNESENMGTPTTAVTATKN